MIYKNVCAVIVTFNPEINKLNNQLQSLFKQIENIIIIDNASAVNFDSELFNFKNIKFVKLNENFGIAKAQNIGIEHVKKLEMEYVLFMDQDSIPAENMLQELLNVYKLKTNVACVGPVYYSEFHSNLGLIYETKLFKQTIHKCTLENPIVSADFLINSGSLIKISVFEIVGFMKEELFIDYVDVEWGLRAKYMSYNNYAVFSAKMFHSLGEHQVSIFGKQIPIHKPFRLYYQFRNAILLYKMNHITITWKFYNAKSMFKRFIFYTVFSKPRWVNFKFIFKGIFHGLIGKNGRMN